MLNETSDQFGSQCIVLAIDARRNTGGRPGWTVYTHGGRQPTERDAVAWAREGVDRGAGEILLTSMDRDGTKDGYDLELTRAVSEAVAVPVIASGGAGTLEHLYEAVTEARPTRCWPPRSSTSASSPSPQAKDYLRSAGWRCACEAATRRGGG